MGITELVAALRTVGRARGTIVAAGERIRRDGERIELADLAITNLSMQPVRRRPVADPMTEALDALEQPGALRR